MELTHAFTVPAGLEETWAAFNDLETVAGCFPGAVVTSVEGDAFTGSAKVKLGPIALVYNGQGQFLEKDPDGHRFVLEAKGKDKRGNGTAGATVTAAFTAVDDTSTNVEVVTDLAITGKPAQFGRGVIQDVSDKLLMQFIACLETTVGAPPAPEAAAAPAEAAAPTGPAAPAAPAEIAEPVEPTPVGAAAEAAAAALSGAGPGPSGAAVGAGTGTGPSGADAAGVTAEPAAARAVPPRREPAQVEALDLGATVLPILLKSYWKQLVGAVLVLLVLRRLLRRRRD